MFPHEEDLSHCAKDFIHCCLEIEPKNRKNIYELLAHPFLKSIIKTEDLNLSITSFDEESTIEQEIEKRIKNAKNNNKNNFDFST